MVGVPSIWRDGLVVPKQRWCPSAMVRNSMIYRERFQGVLLQSGPMCAARELALPENPDTPVVRGLRPIMLDATMEVDPPPSRGSSIRQIVVVQTLLCTSLSSSAHSTAPLKRSPRSPNPQGCHTLWFLPLSGFCAIDYPVLMAEEHSVVLTDADMHHRFLCFGSVGTTTAESAYASPPQGIPLFATAVSLKPENV